MKRIACLLLVISVLVSVVSVSAAEEKTVVDFVLVLDCSGSMLKYDPNHLAATACKSFIDMIPIQDARVSVITFGYGGGGFDFKTFNVTYDKNLVHQIAPLTGEMTVEQKVALQEKITAAAKKDGDNTPVGQALAAAVETLISGGSTDGNACVILLSDGGLTSPIAYQESENLVDSAAKKAKEHEWPIYCIELDYRNSNDGETKENRQRLNRICELSGAGKDGRTKVSSSDEVWDAFWKIFQKFTEPVGAEHEELKIGEDGTVEKHFTVPELASETNVIIYGKSVDAVELINKTQNTSVKFTSSKADKKYIVNVDPNYFAVKVVCPESGEWIAKVYGDKNATVDAYSHHVREMALDIVASPDGSERLTKNDTIKIQSYFSYGETDLTNNVFYTQNKASLLVVSQDGTKYEFEMTGETNGYHYELPVNAVPSGKFTVQVVLKNDMFRNGEKVSDPITFVSENLPLTLNPNAAPLSLEGYVNGTFADVDLTTIYNNPDGDPVEYVLTCNSDRTVSFEILDTEYDLMKIATGMVPGTYQVQIEAKDPDMTEPLVFNGLTLTVENRSIECEKIKTQKVWVDYYSNFLMRQDPDNLILDIDLNDYFTDPDGVELTYSAVTADVPGLVQASMNGSVLHVEPLEKGDVVLKTTVSDGVETIEAEIKIEVVSGKSVYWQTHWIFWAMAFGAILAAILFALYVKSKTYMKGSWMLTVQQNYNTISSEVGMPVRNMSVVKKAKSKPFLMKDLINEYMVFMQDQGNLKNEAVTFLNLPEVKNIKFKGVFGKIGFVFLNQAGSDKVEVEYNGQLKSGVKKFRVNGGEIRVTLKRTSEMGYDETLSFFFKCTGK